MSKVGVQKISHADVMPIFHFKQKYHKAGHINMHKNIKKKIVK